MRRNVWVLNFVTGRVGKQHRYLARVGDAHNLLNRRFVTVGHFTRIFESMKLAISGPPLALRCGRLIQIARGQAARWCVGRQRVLRPD